MGGSKVLSSMSPVLWGEGLSSPIAAAAWCAPEVTESLVLASFAVFLKLWVHLGLDERLR